MNSQWLRQTGPKLHFALRWYFLNGVACPLNSCNAPSTFHRFMQWNFGDKHIQSLLLYLDDIVVFSSTVEVHLKRLKVVLGRLQKQGQKAKLTSCAFFQQEVWYLGHVISDKGVAADPSKVQVVANWRPPVLSRNCGHSLALSVITVSLCWLLPFTNWCLSWGAPSLKGCQIMHSLANCQNRFEMHKIKLTMATVLAYAAFSLNFTLEVVASHGGLGAVLSQERDGKVRPIAYASRSLKPTECNMTNYSSMMLEFLALKWAMIEKFRRHLLSHKCIVYTDNKLAKPLVNC